MTKTSKVHTKIVLLPNLRRLVPLRKEKRRKTQQRQHTKNPSKPHLVCPREQRGGGGLRDLRTPVLLQVNQA